ncbi:hypothetical protein LR69_02152 [Geobacillus sp. BCO2]|nr:hypothetical protein LR69_02152 [Geobacillus sp. BCO2]
MVRYWIYLLNDDVASHYRHRAEKIVELLREHQYAKAPLKAICRKQVEFITERLSFSRLELGLKQHFAGRVGKKFGAQYVCFANRCRRGSVACRAKAPLASCRRQRAACRGHRAGARSAFADVFWRSMPILPTTTGCLRLGKEENLRNDKIFVAKYCLMAHRLVHC